MVPFADEARAAYNCPITLGSRLPIVWSKHHLLLHPPMQRLRTKVRESNIPRQSDLTEALCGLLSFVEPLGSLESCR
jgi:hypothetical protein